jgi:hypothetical protein
MSYGPKYANGQMIASGIAFDKHVAAVRMDSNPNGEHGSVLDQIMGALKSAWEGNPVSSD